MPANLTPEYRKAEEEYRRTGAPDEKLRCLQHMLRVIPKHKGTDKLQADLKHKIARFRDAVDRQQKKRGPSYRVRPEGAGQIMLVGPPNSGKSAILAALTHAEPDVADYPCSTREPVPGMVEVKGVQVQLVDLPPVWREHCESFVFDNIRAADAALVVIDLAAPDPVAAFEELKLFLSEKHIVLDPIRLDDCSCSERSPGEIEFVPVLNKKDLDPDGELCEMVVGMLEAGTPPLVVSAGTGEGLETVRRAVFELLHVIRIYAKEPGEDPDMSAPFTIPIGGTVLDFAAVVHRDFVDNFRSARVWGSAKYDGQVVQRDHVLRDGDVVELNMQSSA